MESEKWIAVRGYDGHYEVSSLGRVRSIQRLKPNNQPVPERIISQTLTHNGYARVSIQREARKWHPKVHRLVAEAFIPNPLNRPTVNHIDGNKLNNAVENLEWATRSEQMIHAFRVLKIPHPRRRDRAA